MAHGRPSPRPERRGAPRAHQTRESRVRELGQVADEETCWQKSEAPDRSKAKARSLRTAGRHSYYSRNPEANQWRRSWARWRTTQAGRVTSAEPFRKTSAVIQVWFESDAAALAWVAVKASLRKPFVKGMTSSLRDQGRRTTKWQQRR